MRAIAVVALGGALGAISRYGVQLGAPSPWTVAAINIVGAFAAGLLIGLLEGRKPLVRLLIGVGFLGAFTTFSAAMLDVHLLWADQRVVAGLVLLLVVPIAAVLAAGGGWRWGERLRARAAS